MTSTATTANDDATWDAEAFAELINEADDTWKESPNMKTTVKRVQDLSLGLSSEHQQTTAANGGSKGNEESWPYESSPCRLFGGKNTKKGGEAINKELFDPDFSSGHSDHVSFSDVDSFCGEEDDHSRSSASSRASAASRSQKNPSSKSAKDKRDAVSHTQFLAWNKKQNSECSLSNGDDDDDGDNDHADTGKGQVREDRTKDRKTSLSSTNSSEGNSGRRKKEKDSQRSVSMDKAQSQRDLGSGRTKSRSSLVRASSHRAMGLVRSGSQRALGLVKSTSQRALNAISKHGDDDTKKEEQQHGSIRSKTKQHSEEKAGATTTTTTTTGADEEGDSRSATERRKSRRTELSAATVHGSADNNAYSKGPTRRSTRGTTMTSRNKSGDGMMEIRGASRGNKDELGTATLHGKSSISRIRKERRGSLDSKNSTGSVRRAKPDRRSMMKRAMSTTNVKRPEEYANALTGEQGEESPRRRGQRKPEPPRRDIMMLLREQKEVTERDVADRDNRRTLHQLMLEAKLGISLKELAKSVKQEIMDGCVPSRPVPSLYIET